MNRKIAKGGREKMRKAEKYIYLSVGIIGAVIFLFFGYVIIGSIIAPINMRKIAAAHLQEKYGIETRGMKLIDYTVTREASFMGSGWRMSGWILVEMSDGRQVRLVERATFYQGKIIHAFYVDDYQLMDECLLSAEYFSGIFGLDIGFVELYGISARGGNILQLPLSDLYYSYRFYKHVPGEETWDYEQSKLAKGETYHILDRLDGRITRENISEYLYLYMNMQGLQGIVMYIRVDFEKDDVDSMFANAYEAFLASPLAETNAELILCFHDVDLDIRFSDPLNGAPSYLGNYYVARSKDMGREEHQHFPLKAQFHYNDLYQYGYRAYALRQHDTDKIGNMAESDRKHGW